MRYSGQVFYYAALAFCAIALVFSVVGFVFLADHQKMGRILWRSFHLPSLGVVVYPDALFALEIGNFYFDSTNTEAYDPEKAEKFFKKSLQIDSLVPDAWHQLARIDFLRGDFDGALNKINTQITLHGKDLMSSFYIRGLVYGYGGDFARAEKDFLEFLLWDPENWAARNDLAWVYFSQGDFINAKSTADRGLVSNPRNPWLLSMSGVSRLNLGDKEGAALFLKKALQEAERLTIEDWLRAYPGNDPTLASTGLAEMLNAIRANYDLAQGVENKE